MKTQIYCGVVILQNIMHKNKERKAWKLSFIAKLCFCLPLKTAREKNIFGHKTGTLLLTKQNYCIQIENTVETGPYGHEGGMP